MEREKLVRTTRLDSGAKLYIKKIAAKNLWRIKRGNPDYEIDDLVQDGYWLWHDLLNRPRYRNLTDRPQIMQLFKLAYSSWISDLARRGMAEWSKDPSKRLEAHFEEYDPAVMDTAEPEQQTFHTLCSKAPEPVKRVLRLVSSSEGCAKLRKPYRIYKDGSEETLNDRLCRLCKLGDIDVESMIRQYFHIGFSLRPPTAKRPYCVLEGDASMLIGTIKGAIAA